MSTTPNDLSRIPASVTDATNTPNNKGQQELLRFSGSRLNDFDSEQPREEQVAIDLIDEASMESFPCSDPPSYSTCHI